MRIAWFVGIACALAAPFACSSEFTSEGTGGASSTESASTSGAGGSTGSGTPCSQDTDCPPSSECTDSRCVEGACSVVQIMANTPVSNPVIGNCYAEVCDGAGMQTAVPDSTDVFDDGNQCTEDKCVNNVPQNIAQEGAACTGEPGEKICDATGSCVECLQNGDCMGLTCSNGFCVDATCIDGDKNGTETDIDCGGACAPCDDGLHCLVPTDCSSEVCEGQTCQVPTCNDGTANGSETDTDCGGNCAACEAGRRCQSADDCESGVCDMGFCAGASCSDGLKNGQETDVDCGGGSSGSGSGCPKCDDGQNCNDHNDCVTDGCNLGVCDHCVNGKTDFGESDQDCGKVCPSQCPNQSTCFVDGDCMSMSCCANTAGAGICLDICPVET